MKQNKRAYTDYPESMFAIITRAQSGELPMNVEMTRRQASASRHMFYRFCRAIASASKTGDARAFELNAVAKAIMVRINPASGEPDDVVQLIFELSPLEAMLIEKRPDQPTTDVPQFDPNEIERILSGRK